MKAVLQRVMEASVRVDGEGIGSIGKGFFILLGVSDEDDEAVADKMADKICKLRIFEDENGKTNLSLKDVGGEVLVVSHHGSRYSSDETFLRAIRPEVGIISVGDNSYGHPSGQAMERLEDIGADIWRTDRQGTVRVTVKGEN